MNRRYTPKTRFSVVKTRLKMTKSKFTKKSESYFRICYGGQKIFEKLKLPWQPFLKVAVIQETNVYDCSSQPEAALLTTQITGCKK